MDQGVTALVPIKHNSERIPQKNYRLFAGLPLYHHIITTLLEVDQINQIVVDTDSIILKEGISENFPTVKVIDRPKHLRSDETPMNDILLHDTSVFESGFYVQTHTTNPLLKAQTISDAISHFFDNYPMYDSLFTVNRVQTRLWDQLARPINHNSSILLPTQQLPPIYEENSNLYIFNRETLVNYHNRIGTRPYLYEVNSLESIDIDVMNDFIIAETIYEQGLVK